MKKRIGRKRVLMLVENSSYPEDIRIFHEATALAEAGYLVSVICQSRQNRPWREVQEGIYVFRYPRLIWGEGFLKYIWEYSYSLLAMFFLSILVLLKPGFDYIHVANPPDTMVFIGGFYKLFGKRFVFDHHDLSPETYQIKFGTNKFVHVAVYKILIALEKLSCRLADHIIATNQSFKAIEMERCGVSINRITVVRNGPNTDVVHLVQPDPKFIGRAKTIFAYLGSMAKQDGVDHLLRALWYLNQTFGYSDWFCVLVGPAEDQQSLLKLVNVLDLDGQIWFTGYQPVNQWLSILSAADICVEPAPYNPVNNSSTMVKLTEYMALGKPSVAYDLRENRITAGAAALYAQPNDEIDLARQFIKLLNSPELRFRLGEIGLQRVKEQIAWSHQIKYLLAAYENIDADFIMNRNRS